MLQLVSSSAPAAAHWLSQQAGLDTPASDQFEAAADSPSCLPASIHLKPKPPPGGTGPQGPQAIYPRRRPLVSCCPPPSSPRHPIPGLLGACPFLLSCCNPWDCPSRRRHTDSNADCARFILRRHSRHRATNCSHTAWPACINKHSCAAFLITAIFRHEA